MKFKSGQYIIDRQRWKKHIAVKNLNPHVLQLFY